MGSVIVCRRQDHNLEMEAGVAGLPPPAVAQDGDGAGGEERTVVFSVFSTHNKRDTSYPGG